MTILDVYTNVYICIYFSGLVHAGATKLCSSLSTQPCLHFSNNFALYRNLNSLL